MRATAGRVALAFTPGQEMWRRTGAACRCPCLCEHPRAFASLLRWRLEDQLVESVPVPGKVQSVHFSRDRLVIAKRLKSGE